MVQVLEVVLPPRLRKALAGSVMTISRTGKSSVPPRCAGGINYVFAEEFTGSHKRDMELKEREKVVLDEQ